MVSTGFKFITADGKTHVQSDLNAVLQYYKDIFVHPITIPSMETVCEAAPSIKVASPLSLPRPSMPSTYVPHYGSLAPVTSKYPPVVSKDSYGAIPALNNFGTLPTPAATVPKAQYGSMPTPFGTMPVPMPSGSGKIQSYGSLPLTALPNSGSSTTTSPANTSEPQEKVSAPPKTETANEVTQDIVSTAKPIGSIN